jgi:hypothetical protein
LKIVLAELPFNALLTVATVKISTGAETSQYLMLAARAVSVVVTAAGAATTR